MDYKYTCCNGHQIIAWNGAFDCPICSIENEKNEKFRKALNENSSKHAWTDSRNGDKPETSEQISARLATETLLKFFKHCEPMEEHKMSLIELVMYGVILHALNKSDERKLEKNDQRAAFIVGYLASKLPMSKIEFNFKE